MERAERKANTEFALNDGPEAGGISHPTMIPAEHGRETAKVSSFVCNSHNLV